MPIAPSQLFGSVGLTCSGTVRWGSRVPCDQPGVYMISTSEDVSDCTPWTSAPFDIAAVQAWIARVPQMRLNGDVPTAPGIVQHLSSYWHSLECVVYIGKATKLDERVRAFNSHTLGNGSPHKGGHWLKALSRLHDLWFHYALTPRGAKPEDFETAALDVFQSHVLSSNPTFAGVPVRAIPFANRKHRVRKQSALTPEHV